jgi:malate dehydrogenase (quinone)
MLDVVQKIYPAEFQKWQPGIKALVPSYGLELNDDSQLAAASLVRTARALKLKA